MRTIVFTGQSAGAPSYLPGTAFQWAAVASSGIIPPVKQSPGSGLPETGSAMFAYSGATIDPVRKEMLIVNGGGHNDYCGNEAYRLRLGVTSPAWERIANASADNVILQRYASTVWSASSVPAGDFARHTDGLPISTHNCTEQQFHNGRVWFTGQSAWGAGTSTNTPTTFSFNRDTLGDGSFPVSHATYVSSWVSHGWATASLLNAEGFMPSAVDTQRNRVWAPNAQVNTIHSLNTATGVAEGSRLSIYTGQQGRSAGTNWASITERGLNTPSWMCCAPDLGLLVMGCAQRNTVAVWDVSGVSPVSLNSKQVLTTDTLGATIHWDETTKFGRQNSTVFEPSYNAIYHAGSKSILLWEARRQPSGKIRQIRIPNSGGVYNAAPTTWAVVTHNTTSWPGYDLGDSTYGRFNYVPDIGGGVAALVCAPGRTLPTYVCRLGTLT